MRISLAPNLPRDSNPPWKILSLIKQREVRWPLRACQCEDEMFPTKIPGRLVIEYDEN